MASSSSSEPPCKRQRLIIKFSSPSSSEKKIITCYLLPKNTTTPTPPTIQENSSVGVKESVVVADPKVSSKPPTTILRKVCVDDVSLTARNEKRRPLLVTHTTDQKTFGKENAYVGCKNIINNVTNEAKTPSSDKDHPPKTENCGLKRNDGIAQLMKKEKKKPMENYKRMQCWVILKNMIEGRDGWALKHPLDPNYLNGLEKNIDSKTKPRCLRDIEAKLNSYSTPNEFAEDMRSVFSHGMLYPPSDEYDVHKIAKTFSDIFENKWKTLKMEWGFEDRRRLNKNIHKMLKVQSKRKR